MKKKYIFKSEIKELLNLMINSLYSNKEIFLRELISNASDALDKIKFKSISDHNILEKDTFLKIRISFNKENNTISISDNGIGMTYKELIKNIGTIAKSGTKEFLKKIKYKEKFIGKFGVGFYSSFMVADKVVVKTKSPYENYGFIWQSEGKGFYTIKKIEKKSRGTKVILFIKNKEKEFLNYFKLKSLISKYSDYISFPIEMKKTEENNSSLTTWKRINKTQAIWIKDKKSIKDKEYRDFYKYFSNDVNDPLICIHNKVEGNNEYISLLYIPCNIQWDIWNRDYKYGIKLYIQRVFVMDEAKQFLPMYMRFIKGIIDSNSMPLNISREMLQSNSLVKKINISCTKKILTTLKKISISQPKKYQKFWNNFGIFLKEGISEDNINKDLIISLLRFSSSFNKNNEQNISLLDYVNRINKNQDKIYYICSENYETAKNHPYLDFFNKEKIEVLFMYDKIDEWIINFISKFKNYNFQSINKLESKKISTKFYEENENIKKIIDLAKEYYDKSLIKDVRLSEKLVDSPVALVTDSNDISTQMAKLFESSGQLAPKVTYIFEINANHDLIKNISLKKDEELKEWLDFLLDQALLIECGSIKNINSFIKRINKLLINNNISNKIIIT
ncbi:MAG: molecular chaperone HtpG [Enterobacteriaceae bacterium]